MTRYDGIRSELKKLAIQLLGYGSSCVFGTVVRQKLNDVNDRWKNLCEKLGMTYKDAEETLFLLKLLEEMLDQLTSWLNGVNERLKQVKLDSCSPDEIKRFIMDTEVNADFLLNDVFCFDFFR